MSIRQFINKPTVWIIKLLSKATTNHSRQKEKEIECLLTGHKWKNKFKANEELSKPVTHRVYCERCGRYYCEIHYKK